MSLKPIQRSWDDYFIPGTSTLRNLFVSPGNPYRETDPSKLRMLEEHRANLRLLQLAESRIRGQFDYDHMKAIHRHIFQDVYEWAGEERTAPDGPMFKGSYAYYLAGPALTVAAEEQYRLIAEADHLCGMELEDFVQARFHSQGSGSNDRLAAVLAKVVSRKPGAPE